MVDEARAHRDEPERDRRRGAWSQARFPVAILLVALASAAFAIAFRAALSAVFRFTLNARDVVEAMADAPWFVRLLAPMLGALAGGLVSLATAKTAGGGVGDVMEAVVLGRGRLSLAATTLKSFASWLAIASGGSIGREGPLIQFGGASGNLIGEKLAVREDHRRTLIAAGTAAGFAAAYNTPFAATLFVLEVVTGIVVLDAILPVVVATVIATAVTRAFVGEGPIYGQRAFHLESPFELLAFAGLGLATALAAQAFMRVLSFGERLFHRSWLRLPVRPALGGALAGACVVALPEVAGNGYEPLNSLLDEKYAIAFVAVLLAGKIVATTCSVSSGSPGGVFTPTLLIGGCVGFLYAAGLASLDVHIGPAAGYALVGMAAATAATTHAPLMAAVMAFELSGDYAVALPLLIATAIATGVSKALRRESIYGAELKRRGVEWELTLAGRSVKEAARSASPADKGAGDDT